MRHRKNTFRLGTNGSHRKSMVVALLKALVEQGRIETSTSKAKFIKPYADRLITTAKKGDLASKRKAIAALRLRNNSLSTKQKRAAKKDGDKSSFNADRTLLEKLDVYKERFAARNGGYTRIMKLDYRRSGDGSERCILEYLPE